MGQVPKTPMTISTPVPRRRPRRGRIDRVRQEDDRRRVLRLARRLGVTQAAISRLEQPHDLLLSTLNAYLAAIGGTARMIVSFAGGHETTLGLSGLR
ncbi:hypothetical protein FRACA_1030012 [Frankia canadensis]|uniref:HTH cro/C1-type domain-containing protein n=1 Tax=Frankia canadensis TaxID=1836972 RepID=A0A2I2KIT3_9ACTN|nr:hypothetical protein FRACA_1030012 [Frankia canadensis]SOU52868.1 hypothetical protein FRACA_1030012 [Frankia canadensis]